LYLGKAGSLRVSCLVSAFLTQSSWRAKYISFSHLRLILKLFPIQPNQLGQALGS